MEILQKYADADVFVLLSEREAYSLVVAEALAAGIHCIVAKTSALTEWVDNKSCFGIEFPIKLGELAELIYAVINYAASHKNKKSLIQTKAFDWDEVSQRLELVYV